MRRWLGAPAPERTSRVTSEGHPSANLAARTRARRPPHRRVGRPASPEGRPRERARAHRDDRDRGRRAGARWLQRWLDETAGATIDEAAFVVGCLVALGGLGYGAALSLFGPRRKEALARDAAAA